MMWVKSFLLKEGFGKMRVAFLQTKRKKKGHPGVVTVKSKKGSNTFMLVPGTSGIPKRSLLLLLSLKMSGLFKSKWRTIKTSFVLDYWKRSVSRNGPI